MRATLLYAILLCVTAWSARPATAQQTFLVTSSADPGDGICDAAECTLREAIAAANATTERDSIHFAIPGDGVQTIVLASQPPTVSQRAVIDGYTQPGASPNTRVVGTDAVLLVEIDASAAAEGIAVTGDGEGRTVIRGLVINRAQSSCIQTRGFSIDIYGNYIGTDPTGTIALGTTNYGINVNHNGPSDVRIGSPDPADRNVISGGSQFSGIVVGGNPSLPQTTAFSIQGNYIGTDASGTVALGNAGVGVQMFHVVNGLIGGVEPGAGNVISANGQAGLTLNSNPNGGSFVSAMTVQGNFIGTDASGTLPLGNGTHGITVGVTGGHQIGGSEAGAGNVVAHNTGAGISVVGSQQLTVAEGNTIRANGADGVELNQFGSGLAFFQFVANSFAANGDLAIDIKCQGDPDPDGGGPTPNDPGDADEGSNRCQNTPEIVSSGTTIDGDLIVTYRVDTDPANATYPLTVELYKAESEAELEGEVFLGSDTYSESDWQAGGSMPGTRTVNVGSAADLGVAEGDVVIGTATDAVGYTSEFSASASIVVASEAAAEVQPHSVELLGAFPNPSRGRATVVLDVQRPEWIRVSVYDVLGREVAVLHDGVAAAGRRDVDLDAATWAAGLYIVRLESERNSQSLALAISR